MIKEFSVHPKPRNNKAKIAFLIAILVSAAGFVTYFLMDRYKGLIGVFALMCLTTAILFYTKFISPEFYYDITFDSSDNPLFVVRQLVGKRQTTLCRIDLADIVSVKHETAKERKAHSTPLGTRKYVYAPTMLPSDIYRITVKGRYENSEIIIEATEEFAELLISYALKARELNSYDGE